MKNTGLFVIWKEIILTFVSLRNILTIETDEGE